MRQPDRIIGDRYLHRWHIIPRNRFFNIYLHRFLGSDDDRAHHDHPWYSVSFLLKGKLVEHFAGQFTENGSFYSDKRVIKRWRPYFRNATMSHRIELASDEAWTLFITGFKIRDWGFICRKGWVHWKEFCDEAGNKIGKGCD